MAIEAQVERLAASAGGVAGVAAWRLDGTGPRVLCNAHERFPMASTFKVAVAGAVLAAVDAGRLSLDQPATVDPAMRVPSGVIGDHLIHPGVCLSLHNFLELMLTISDNTATDVLMKHAGGAAAVTAWVRAQGIDALRVDRDTARLLRDFFGLPDGPLKAKDMEAGDASPNAAFDDDPRDTATPVAMAELLACIFNGNALSASSTAVLVSSMERCRTGDDRLRGELPPGTTVAHKTGTIGGTVNDVGVITLPGGQGRIVIAVFIKKSDLPVVQRERAIAAIARTIHDYYLSGGTA
jgi:beta-lactamase class A